MSATGRERGESFLDQQAEKKLRDMRSPTAARDDLVHHEAERATIAALIRNGGDPIGRLGITADLFALDATREAFQAVDLMFRSGVHPDAATLRNALSDATYIEIETTIGEHVPAANLPAHVAILKDYRQRRAEAAARDRLARAIESSVPPHELASLFEAVRAASAGDSGDKTAPPDIEILPTGEIIGGDVPAPGSRIDLKNRGNRLLQQARALRLAEAEKREPPPEQPDIEPDIARDNPRQPTKPLSPLDGDITRYLANVAGTATEDEVHRQTSHGQQGRTLPLVRVALHKLVAAGVVDKVNGQYRLAGRVTP